MSTREKHPCSECGETKRVRKVNHQAVWLCSNCSEKRSRIKIRTYFSERYGSRREAQEAYEDHLEYRSSSKSWPTFSVLMQAYAERKQSLGALALKWGLNKNSVCIWYRRVQHLLPGKLSGRKRNRICSHGHRVSISQNEFLDDSYLRCLRSKAEVLGFSYTFVPSYDRTALKKYKTREAYVNGYHCRLASILGPCKGTLYWRWHVKTSQLSNLDFLILEARTPNLVHVPIPAALALEQFKNKKVFRVNIPFDGRRRRISQVSTYDWQQFVENWNPFIIAKIPVLKKMAKMGMKKPGMLTPRPAVS